MSDSESASRNHTPHPDRKPPFQFSLAWLLIAATVFAVVLAFSQTVIGIYVIASLASAMVDGILPAALVIGALFGRGELRLFSIGALVPWVVTRPHVQISPGYSPAWWPIIVTWVFTLVTAAVCGVVAVASYRWIQRHGYGA